MLPVTALNFGRIVPPLSSGKHTLGPFQCTGKRTIPTAPSSCRDLFVIGHELNGLYLIKSITSDRVDTVFCDFTQLQDDPSTLMKCHLKMGNCLMSFDVVAGFQTMIGRTNIQSSSAYFYVQRSTTYGTLNSVVPFDIARLNIGGAMNLATGVFTAPVNGRYHFTLSGIANVAGTRLQLEVNGSSVIGTASGQATSTYALQSTLSLKMGDRVTLTLLAGGISDTAAIQYTHYTGMLLEEDLVL